MSALAGLLALSACGSPPKQPEWLVLPLPPARAHAPLPDSMIAPLNPGTSAPPDRSPDRRLDRRPDGSRDATVDGAAGATGLTPPAASSTAPGNPVLHVRRVAIPEYVQVSQVRYRSADSVIAAWPDVRWGERLDVAITDRLVASLRTALPGWTVCERRCPADGPTWSLQIDIGTLDYVRTSGALRMQAQWILGARPAGRWDITVDVRPDSPQGQALAVAEAVDRLADALAPGLVRAARDTPAIPPAATRPPTTSPSGPAFMPSLRRQP